MLVRLNQVLGRMMPLITPVSVLLGVLLAAYLKDVTFLVPWVFAVMTFSGSLSSAFSALKHTVMHPLPLILTFLILHVLMPLYAWSAGHLIFAGDSMTITGLTLAMVIPTGVSSLIWAVMYKGNVGLTLSIILIDTLLSPLIVPVSLSIFVGTQVHMDMVAIMKGLLGMVVLPSILGMLVRQYAKPSVTKAMSQTLAPFSKLGLFVVVSINSSVVAPYLRELDAPFFSKAATVFFIAMSGYAFAWLIGKAMKCTQGEIVAIVYTGGMRNISAGAVLAISFFPPAVAVPVVICMLFQQVLAAFFGFLLNRFELKEPAVIKSLS
ncbi:bile acid:sodium symporter family protein [Bacillus aerius]|uniref:bile acid:sodium symporter family protein n=1 Tax=Bacillus aerius TaxID=293388 RepID=UPI002814F1A7|nr:bile acid:sodium symporter family protein [Bacillus aerius]WMT28944.1 bile acid:sodium symporter family protein [Bacillus aerius]